MTIKRNRPCLALGIGAVIVLGLASRHWPMFPAALGKYPGDTLWALMVFLGMAFIRPRSRTWSISTLALAFSYLIEASQLYQAPWINGIRGTTLGHLVLGSGFDWHDLIAYAVGVAMGALADLALQRRCRSGMKS